MSQINASIVLYHNKKEEVLKVIHSFLTTKLSKKLYLIDNSQTDALRQLATIDTKIDYIFNNANLGYGAAHNIALKKTIEHNVPYHLVLNPDVYFQAGVLEKLYDYMDNHKDVGLVMPKVLYPNGELQYLSKILPSPLDLILRRLMPFSNWVAKRNYRYELRFTQYNQIMNVPYLSGCFMFLRTEALKQVGIFDERFFMYLEDTDLSRRIHKNFKTIYFPYAEIVHTYQKGSYNNFTLLKYHIKSAIQYFNKWGWFFDKEREKFNSLLLANLKKDENPKQ